MYCPVRDSWQKKHLAKVDQQKKSDGRRNVVPEEKAHVNNNVCRQTQMATKFKINNDVIENVIGFEYCDSIINNNKDCTKEIRHRLAMAIQMLNNIKSL